MSRSVGVLAAPPPARPPNETFGGPEQPHTPSEKLFRQLQCGGPLGTLMEGFGMGIIALRSSAASVNFPNTQLLAGFGFAQCQSAASHIQPPTPQLLAHCG